jgi:hypothetical protein
LPEENIYGKEVINDKLKAAFKKIVGYTKTAYLRDLDVFL